MIQALRRTSQTADASSVAPLRECCLITDGNSHRTDLYSEDIGFFHKDLISEAMLPEIRMVAMLIAAQRRETEQRSPAVFTDEADWFAARIIVLKVRVFCLDVCLLPMLKIANARAEAFARSRGLPFQAAQIRPSLHSGRPANMLLMACDLQGVEREGCLQNSRAVREQCVKQLKLA